MLRSEGFPVCRLPIFPMKALQLCVPAHPLRCFAVELKSDLQQLRNLLFCQVPLGVIGSLLLAPSSQARLIPITKAAVDITLFLLILHELLIPLLPIGSRIGWEAMRKRWEQLVHWGVPESVSNISDH